MSAPNPVRGRFVDAPGSLAAQYRQRRWERLRTEFPDFDEMSVIDLGGRVEAWRRAPARPAHVHIINLEPPDPDPPSWMETDTADACQLPAAILSRRYDLVFSNSVLEHVGGHANRLAFAQSVHTLAAKHWIQTPYRYFPIEPHWLFPWFQHLPVAARVFISRGWPLVHTRSRSAQRALSAVQWTELVGITEMSAYFPDSRIVRERFGPLVKSLIAVRK